MCAGTLSVFCASSFLTATGSSFGFSGAGSFAFSWNASASASFKLLRFSVNIMRGSSLFDGGRLRASRDIAVGTARGGTDGTGRGTEGVDFENGSGAFVDRTGAGVGVGRGTDEGVCSFFCGNGGTGGRTGAGAGADAGTVGVGAGVG